MRAQAVILCTAAVGAAICNSIPAVALDLAEGRTTVTVVAHPLTPASAPADEYFGSFKLSNLGVKNIIRAFRVEGDSPLALPLQRARIEGVDSALFAWGDKYPRDPWLAGAIFGFIDVLERKDDVEADAMAIDLLLQASERYRNTKYSRLALEQLVAIRPPSAVDWTGLPFDPPAVDELVVITHR